MQTNVKIVADSKLGNTDNRITSFEIEYPRFILAEINTHRIISKSSASSRAIPVEKRIKQVENEPFIPYAFGKNRPGMQSSENIDNQDAAKEVWIKASKDAVTAAKHMLDLGVHKQHANRLLEPYVYVKTVLTATEWDNFFNLRISNDAQPEFSELASMMRDAYLKSKPEVLEFGDYHLPYITAREKEDYHHDDLLYVSTARCARVSYKMFDGRSFDFDADVNLYSKLIEMRHLSPFDHPAIAGENKQYRQYYGFKPYRVLIEEQNDIDCSKLN
jgi:thymidylate synthase ThyX